MPGSPARRQGLLLAASVGIASLGFAVLPANADPTPITWDGGGNTDAASEAANWAGDALPTLTGDDTLVFPDGVTDRTVLMDLVVDGGQNEDTQALLEAVQFGAAGYTVNHGTGLTFLPPHLYGDDDLRALDDGERQLVLAQAAGQVNLDLALELDPQEVPGHLTAADPGTVISCVPPDESTYPFNTCYLLDSGDVIFDGPGTHHLLGYVYGDQPDGEDPGDTVHIRDGRTIVAGSAIETATIVVEAEGTLQLGEGVGGPEDRSGSTNASAVLVGGGGRIEGNGALQCECFGVVVVGNFDPFQGYVAPSGAGYLAPGFAGLTPDDAIGTLFIPELHLGYAGRYAADWLETEEGAHCDRIDTNHFSTEEQNGDPPALELDLPDVDLPAGATCTIVDVLTDPLGGGGGDEEPPPACDPEAILSDPFGNRLDQLDGDGLLFVDNPASRNGVESILVDYCSGEDGQDITLRVLPNVLFTVDDGAEATQDPVETGYSVSDTVQELEQDGPEDDPLVFAMEIVGGSATAPDDYTAAEGDLEVGVQNLTSGFQELVVDDDLEELFPETIDFEWTPVYPESWDADRYIVIGSNQATGSIADDDVAAASVADVSVQESAGTATVTITLSGPSVIDRTFHVTTSDQTAVAPGDYEAEPGADVTIPAGETSASVEIPIVSDQVDEPDETFLVTIVETTEEPCISDSPCVDDVAPAAVADGQAVVTILDDDAAPTTTTSTTAPPTTAPPVVESATVQQPIARTGARSTWPLAAIGMWFVAAGLLVRGLADARPKT